MAINSGASSGGMGGGLGASAVSRQTQTINGQSYLMYSPEWYAAMDAQKVHEGSIAGQAAGTGAGAAAKASYETKYPGSATPPPPAPFNIASLGLGAGAGAPTSAPMAGLQVSGGGGVPSAPPPPSFSSFSGGASGAPGGGGGTPPPVPQIAAPNTAGANANAFARAKDQVGLQTRGALTGLAGAMAGRGTVGSGVEGRGQQGIINQGQQQLGEVSREQSIQDSQLAQRNAELAYSGGITQRGQDISHIDTQNSQALTGRGQDMSYASTNRGQDITQQDAIMGNTTAMRGQDIQAQQNRADLAFRALLAQYGQQGAAY